MKDPANSLRSLSTFRLSVSDPRLEWTAIELRSSSPTHTAGRGPELDDRQYFADDRDPG